jgi:lipoic acid synthetase
MEPHRKKPEWLKIQPGGGQAYRKVARSIHHRQLHTVCEEALCPNKGECFNQGTATFMILGKCCTRACRFCNVQSARQGEPLDENEPAQLARAVGELELDYVVITSVDRDDLADLGAAHFARTVRAIKAANPQVIVEVLVPDFQGQKALIETVLAAEPEVFGHNIETVARLTSSVRDPRASYQVSLEVLATAKSLSPQTYTKSSLLLGLGETPAEIIQALTDLRAAAVDIVTLGQYLRPSRRHLAVTEYVTPAMFEEYAAAGKAMGFLYVASGPLVRSSYRSGEFFIRHVLAQKAPGRERGGHEY